MVEIRVFGKLRRYISEPETEGGNLLKVTPQPQETLEQLLARIGIPLDDIYTKNLQRILNLTTFRSKVGLWGKYDPMVYASIETFKEDPSKYWTIHGGPAGSIFARSGAAKRGQNRRNQYRVCFSDCGYCG